MANEEQVARLKNSVAQWNVWRENNPTTRLDLSYADLSGVKLNGAKLNSAKLNGAKLNGACLNGTRLNGADLSHANLSRADLSYADLSRANLSYADLSRADLSRANLSGSHLSHANFNYAHLNGTHFSGADFSDADFSDADLSYADLSNVHLSKTIFKESHVGWTIFGNLDLRTVQGLETIHHRGPSTIGTDTIVRSAGAIPDVFLRGAGLSDTFINYVRSLFNAPEYYTCFISYSSTNEDFAKRLYTDLQSNGVRCWFAPEHMNVGDKIRPRIDESIRLYDKLLLVLSKDSIASNWVAYEVERALNKEPTGIHNVLYPVRLDDEILACTTSWAQDIKDTRHIGDFTTWKEHDAYQKSFDRLLRALKASKPSKG